MSSSMITILKLALERTAVILKVLESFFVLQVLGEATGSTVSNGTLSAVTAASKLGGPVRCWWTHAWGDSNYSLGRRSKREES